MYKDLVNANPPQYNMLFMSHNYNMLFSAQLYDVWSAEYPIAEAQPPLPADTLGPLLDSCLTIPEEERAAKRSRWLAQRDTAMGIPDDREVL
jgi:hypothetical protein